MPLTLTNLRIGSVMHTCFFCQLVTNLNNKNMSQKTVLQELVEDIDTIVKVLPDEAIGAKNQAIIIKSKAESFLEKEKQQIIDAYKKGYEQRVVDQLQGALNGNPVGSHYKEEKLGELANAYASKHCA